MTSSEIKAYIDARNGELCSDEIWHVIDVSRNPQLNHIELINGKWNAWDVDGNHFYFNLRTWS